ncbi:MAG: hypothetical protein Q9163_001787 [Psora crenata]
MASQLPADAIQRILFLASRVHVYSIPPLTSNRGYTASTWTENNNARQIFMARLRILETSIPPAPSSPSTLGASAEKITTEILLEDPATGELFAGAPYTDKQAVEAAVDSSRFFAVRVVGDGGRKAVLGIGFEERSEAIDFEICLQECRKVMGFEGRDATIKGANGAGRATAGRKGEVEKRDWSLKEGETIKIDIGRMGRRKNDGNRGGAEDGDSRSAAEKAALFSIKPPPRAAVETISAADSAGSAAAREGGIPTLAPPPSAQKVRAEKRRSRDVNPGKADAKGLGFDDGEFGEFQ